MGAHLDDERGERLAALTVHDPVAWAGRLLPELGCAAAWRRRRSTRLRRSPPGPHARARVARRGARRGGPRAALGDLLRVRRRPRVPASRAARRRDGGRGRRAARRLLEAHLCSNRTCEIGLRRATGADYTSFLFLLEELTRA